MRGASNSPKKVKVLVRAAPFFPDDSCNVTDSALPTVSVHELNEATIHNAAIDQPKRIRVIVPSGVGWDEIFGDLEMASCHDRALCQRFSSQDGFRSIHQIS